MKPTASLILNALTAGLLATHSYRAQAARQCTEHFSEEGDWSSGKTFKSYVEVQGSTSDKVMVAIGRELAKDGMHGVSLNKELGIVSSYQENNGKQSTWTFSVTDTGTGSLRVEGVVHLHPGLRAPVGAARDTLCKFLESTLSQSERTSASAESSIALKGQPEDRPLKIVVGQLKKTGMEAFPLYYYDFGDTRAVIRTRERRPVLLVRANTDPAKLYVLARCDVDKDNDKRSIKVKPNGVWSGQLQPDEDWTFPVKSTESQPGVWQLVPSKDLKPGEYGLWDIKGFGVALFGVD